MTGIVAFLNRLRAPMPWRVCLQWHRGEEAHGLVDANGVKIDLRIWETQADARRMAAIGAIAPTALAYVERAAAKGGKEAAQILAEFEAMATGQPR